MAGRRDDDRAARAAAEPIELAPYDPASPARFRAEVAELKRLLGEVPLGRIAHIGSTAVPGLSGKPIIDLMVEVPDYATVRDRIAPVLTRNSYEFFFRPHGPGSEGIDYAWFIRRDDQGRRTHHVHMAPAGSPYWDRVTFRDRLRADPDLAARYAEIKRRALAEHPGDRAAYSREKGAFIRQVLAR